MHQVHHGGGGRQPSPADLCRPSIAPPPFPGAALWSLPAADVREQYCQLWCALLAGDRAAATEAAVNLGGARAGQILPVILTQRARNKWAALAYYG